MCKRSLTLSLLFALSACSASSDKVLSDASSPVGASPSADSAIASDGSVATQPDATLVPRPVVQLAPTLETALPCDNVELPFDFDASARDFNLDHAFWMMWFAERTLFSDQPETPLELAALGFDRYAHFADTTGLQLYVAGSEKSVVVAFRGSSELQDWIGNFNFPQDEGALHGVAGRVHRGFATALSPSFDAIADTIRMFADAGQSIWLTGHSLGGAEATLSAARLARVGSTLAPVYTFGAPRAGDDVFALDAFEQLEQRVYRIVNELDIVPRLPPAAVAAEESANVLPLLQGTGAQAVQDLDYRHVGQMAWLQYAAGTDLTMMPTMSDDDDKPYWAQAAKNGTIGVIVGNQQQGARHAPQRYLCRMLALRNAEKPIPMPADRAAQEERAREDNWALKATRAIEAWQLVRARGREPGEGILIAHPDTGTSEHPELGHHPFARAPIVWSLGYDFVDGDADPRHDFSALNRVPAHGHGSETSSVMVSPLGCPKADDKGPCVTGAVPAAKLIPLRVTESVVLLSGDKVAEGVRYAIDADAHVIAISMGGVTPMPKLEAAIADALAAGILVVAAAGNNVVVVSPCTIAGVVCVAGVTPELKPWAGSSFGSRVDISGPATEVRFAKTTQDQGTLRYEVGMATGTSDATALTASAAAIWLSYHGRSALLARYGAAGLAPAFRRLIKERAFNTPADWPTDGSFGPGILDMVKLLEAPLP